MSTPLVSTPRESRRGVPSAAATAALQRPEARRATPAAAAIAAGRPSRLGRLFEGPAFDPRPALGLSIARLRAAVVHYAERYLEAHPSHRTPEPEAWAWQFLGCDRSSVEAFAREAGGYMLARQSASGLHLARAAALLAWQVLQADPAFAPAGSLLARVKGWQSPDLHAYLHSTASFHLHSFGIEDAHVDRTAIEASLAAALLR